MVFVEEFTSEDGFWSVSVESIQHCHAGVSIFGTMAPNPLSEALCSNSGDYQRNVEPPASPVSAVRGVVDKRWPRCASVFWRVCCVAVFCYPTVMFRREVTSNSDVDLRGEFENKALLVDAANFSIRTSYHFRPERNWMNGTVYLACLDSQCLVSRMETF